MKNLTFVVVILILLFSQCKMAKDNPMPQTVKTPEVVKPEEDTTGVSNDTISYLALGDSYTIGESVNDNQRFPSLITNALIKNGKVVTETKVIAVTGWTTQNLIDAINTKVKIGETHDIVSLLIGVNNFYQGRSIEEYKIQFEQLLEKSIVLAKGNPKNVFVISIPDYGYTPFGKRTQSTISAGIDLYNNANRNIAYNRGVTYFNITPISRMGLEQPELVASDGLHPSFIMYEKWVELMLPDILTKVK